MSLGIITLKSTVKFKYHHFVIIPNADIGQNIPTLYLLVMWLGSHVSQRNEPWQISVLSLTSIPIQSSVLYLLNVSAPFPVSQLRILPRSDWMSTVREIPMEVLLLA